MPRVHTQVARTDRYRQGAKIEDPKTKSGFRIDKSKPRDENDTLFCKKGQTYYWWQFKNGGKNYSVVYPKPSRLTQSEFYTRVYEIQEELSAASASDFQCDESAILSFKEQIVEQVQELLDELEEKESNLSSYEGLANSPVYELITERRDAVQEWLDELENIDCDYSLDDMKSEAEDENEKDEADEADEEEYASRIDAIVDQKELDRIQEILDELQNCEISV